MLVWPVAPPELELKADLASVIRSNSAIAIRLCCASMGGRVVGDTSKFRRSWKVEWGEVRTTGMVRVHATSIVEKR